MQPPSPPSYEEESMCPECGSTNVEVTKERDIVVQPGNRTINEYRCNDCNLVYFPAFESDKKSNSDRLIEKWSYKTDQTSYLNRKRKEKSNKNNNYFQIRDTKNQ